jgi:hypothetical protein
VNLYTNETIVLRAPHRRTRKRSDFLKNMSSHFRIFKSFEN